MPEAARLDHPSGAASEESILWQAALIGAPALLVVDLLVNVPEVDRVLWLLAVAVIGVAALLAVAAAERVGDPLGRRWRAQALAVGALMLAEMAHATGLTWSDPARWPLAMLAVVLFVFTAIAYVDGPRWGVESGHLALDATIAAATVAILIALLEPAGVSNGALAAVLLGAGAAAVYAVLIAVRGRLRTNPYGPGMLLLLGVLALGLHLGGEVLDHFAWPVIGIFHGPGLPLLAGVALARSARVGLREAPDPATAEPPRESRLRLAPAMAAAVVIALLSVAELTGAASRAGFFGVTALFALLSARLVIALLENRHLLGRVERSGVFEEKLRDLGAALVAALDRKEALQLVCRTAQVTFKADAVVLWMIDPTTDELEAVEVLGPKRRAILHRRIPLHDPDSLAARVARTASAEVVSHVSEASASNPFLNVLLHAQALLAVPISRSGTVQGVLVCMDGRVPAAYGPPDVAKAELLAGQVSVALDNAYQHDLQRRRLEEMTAMYEFAQSAHTALTATEIARLMLPMLKERIQYTYATVWLRDPVTGTLRLAAGDSPGGVPLAGIRPTRLASRAFSTGRPVHAGLGWVEPEAADEPERKGVRSELAVPLVLKHRAVGVVDLESRQPNVYSLNDERLLVSLANHAALAIENLHLLGEARKVEALRELDRMKSELLSTVSHELRTPLGSIKGYATTLLTYEEELPPDERREFLEIIDSEADRLRELIENFLDLSRLEAGVLRIDRHLARLRPSACEVARKVQLATATHEIAVDWPVDYELSVDPRRIYQVMQNLVTNAVKYSPEGGRIVLSGAFGQRELVVSVADQGAGMPAHELERVFDRFHRIGGEMSRRVGGTGLGLAICKGFVEAHGGRIWAESDGEGKGSTFRFTLPVGQLGEPIYESDKECQ